MSDCIFCMRDDPAVNRIMCESDLAYVRYDNYPVSAGHVEIVPKRHVESLFSLIKEARWSLLYGLRPPPDAYTIGVNEGVAAGRTIIMFTFI